MIASTGIWGYVPIMIDQAKKKPLTQGIAVDGFASDMYASDEVKINWMKLINSSKFQWFVCEESGQSSSNVMTWITEFVRQQIMEKGEQAFFDHYLAWHSNKGYWQNEDVYGNLLGED